ncbi:MAG: hypothetical protein U9R60_01010 [Bacteroidota bacterium]|nr:hypothetical protein [Bacteroidota bacterium]
MNIAQSIRTLLDKEGRVIIPGLGTLETKHYPASLNKDKKRLSPPESRTIFVQNLHAEDDQLIKYLADSEKISKQKSTEAIEAYVGSLRYKLKVARKAYIDQIGYLLIRDRHLHFKPDSVNELPELHAEPIEKKVAEKPVVPVIKETETEKVKETVKVKETEKPVKQKREKAASGFASYLAIPLFLLTIMLAMLIYVLVNPMNRDYLKSHYSGHVPLVDYPDNKLKPIPKPVIAEEVKEQPKVITREDKQVSKPEPAVIPTPRTGTYHVIVASLEYRTMAEVYAEKLKRMGYIDAMIIGPAQNGNYRVSLESHKDKSRALVRLMYMRKLVNQHAWLLKY